MIDLIRAMPAYGSRRARAQNDHRKVCDPAQRLIGRKAAPRYLHLMDLLADAPFWSQLIVGVVGALLGGGIAWWLAGRKRLADDRRAMNGILADLIPVLDETESQTKAASNELDDIFLTAQRDRDVNEPIAVFREAARTMWEERRIGREAKNLADIACLISSPKDRTSAEALRAAVRSATAVPPEPVNTEHLAFHRIREGIDYWTSGRAPDFASGVAASDAARAAAVNNW